MDLQLEGQKAFVSGSTQGIGYAIAKGLAHEGAAVVINGRDEARVQDAVARLRVEVPDADVGGVPADLADPSQVAGVTGSLGDVDILVNNVGLFGLAPFEEVTDDDWQRYFDVNVMSGVRLSRAVLPSMLARRRGRIIFMSSESGINVPADMVHYGVTKAAMIALGNGLAKLTRGTDVTVNTIVGGPTYSDGVAGAVNDIARSRSMPVDEMKAAIIGGNRTSLLERFIEPDEIARLAVYLASPVSSATNGATLRADGGVLTSMI